MHEMLSFMVSVAAGVTSNPISKWLDKQGCRFRSREEKIRYVLSIACRAANCGNFNAIPESKLTAIYNLFCRKNSVDISGNPIIDHPIMKN